MPPGRVVIDLSPAQPSQYGERGIARHTLEFVRAVVARHPELIRHLLIDPDRAPLGDIEEWVVGDRTIPLEQWVPRPDDILHVTSPFELDHPLRRLWPRAASAAGTALVVTVYDLIPEIFPADYLADPGLRRRWRARRGLVRAANHLLTLSRSASSDVVELLGLPASRVTQIGAGCSPKFAPPSAGRAAAAAAVRRWVPGLRAGFVVYNGGADPRKNLEGLIVAWSQLPGPVRERWQLVIAGRMPELAEHHYRVRLRQIGLEADVLLTGLVDDARLVALYQGADLMFFPSYYEGYGLPVVEAMACGAPVLAAATSSLVELVEPEATFDPRDVPAMTRALNSGLTDGAYRARLLASSARPRPTWEAAADRAAEIYRALGAGEAGERAPTVADRRAHRPNRGALGTPKSEDPPQHQSSPRNERPPQPGATLARTIGELLGFHEAGYRARTTMALVLPSADSPWAAADHGLADTLEVWAEIDRYGPGAAALSTLARASSVRGGYDVVVLSVAGHQGHFPALDWLLQCHRGVGRRVILIARERSLASYYRSLGDEEFASAWHAHYPEAPCSPSSEHEALMVRAAVARCDWYVVGEPASGARVALELPPALVGRLVTLPG